MILVAPLHFLVLQIPEVSVEAIYAFFPNLREAPLPLIAAVLFPYLAITSFLSSALTFASLRQARAGGNPSLGNSINLVISKSKILFPTSLLTGVILLLGMVALLLPFLYFMALYLFVPFLVMTEGPLPWSVYLHKSKVLAKRRFWSCLALVLLMLAVSFGSDAACNELREWIPSYGLVALKLMVSLVTSAVLGVWTGLFFLEMQEQPA